MRTFVALQNSQPVPSRCHQKPSQLPARQAAPSLSNRSAHEPASCARATPRTERFVFFAGGRLASMPRRGSSAS
ncbi:hypothetical protein HZH68_012853 [Vespula germanica]|uniref:Uncharacterized protein n=1 Tax=Vespula germanica TaxID=30212 RepID=A0A834JGB7_VESGE|nr:hypothetical protein HZH68_012853 [Vespula germanica]